jgi:hypothetical protein
MKKKSEKQEDSREAANKLLSEKIDQATKLIKEAMKIADKHKLTFNFVYDVGGAGTYDGRPDGTENDDNSGDDYFERHGWQASSICY